MKSRMAKSIHRLIAVCQEEYELNQISKYLSQACSWELVTDSEAQYLDRVIASYYKMIEYNRHNQYGIVDI